MEKLNCVRCKHSWYPRTPQRPKYCPKCKQSKWTIPARVRVKRPVGPKRPVGAPVKYPVHDLEIGQSILMPFFMLSPTENDVKKNSSRNAAIRSYAMRSGKKFKIDGDTGKCRITRIA